MKRILFTLSFILISLIGYSQEQKQDYIKVDPLSLGIQTTTITVKTRDEIEQKIDEYNRRLEGLFMEREEWVKLLDQCDKLEIISTQDTIQNESMMGVPLDDNMKVWVKKKDTGSTVTKLHFNETGSPIDTSQVKVSGEILKAKKKTKKAQK